MTHISHHPVRLVVVEATFLIRNRGLVLAPDVPLEVWPAGTSHQISQQISQQIKVEVRRPGAKPTRFWAEATIPFIVPHDPDRPVAFTLILREATKDCVPIGSEVWLIS